MKLLVLPAHHQKKRLLSKDVHDQRKHSDQLKKYECPTNHRQGIVQMKVVEEILIGVKLNG